MTRTRMTPRRRRWLSGLLGSALLVLVLVIVSFDDRYTPEPPDAVVLRQVEVYEPPPPPPPPATNRRTSSSAGAPMRIANTETPIVLEVMDLNADVSAGQFGDFGSGGIGEGVGVGMGIVDFADLDEVPMVVRAPALTYPEEAAARGIDEFRVFIHVLIDEEGRTYPLGIVQNPITSFNQDALNYASEVRFTPPKRLGIPVRTEYLWPLLIKRPPTPAPASP